MSKLIATWCAALVLLLASAGHALELQLHATKVGYRSGEPVVVRVLVVNPVGSKETWYLKRSFWLVPYSYPMDGDVGLIIQVRNSGGELLKVTSSSMIVVRSRTDPIMFQPLYPGSIFGQDVALDGPGLEYDLRKPGGYRVTATLSPAAPRAWFDKWREANPGQQYIAFKREELFEGPAFSPPVDVQIVE